MKYFIDLFIIGCYCCATFGQFRNKNYLLFFLGDLKFTTRDFKITTPVSLIGKSALTAENLPTIATTSKSFIEGVIDENAYKEDDIVLLTTLESVNDGENTEIDNDRDNTESILLLTTPKSIDTNKNTILDIRKETTTPNSLKKYTQWFNNVNKLLFTSPNDDKNEIAEDNTEIQITTEPTVVQITTVVDSANDVVFTTTSTTTTTTPEPPTTPQTTTTTTTTTERQSSGLGDIAYNLATQDNNFFNSVFKTLFGI